MENAHTTRIMQRAIKTATRCFERVKQHIYPTIPSTIGEEHTRAQVRRAVTKTVVAYTLFDIVFESYKEYKIITDATTRKHQRAKLDALDRHYKTNGYGGWFW